MKKISSLIIIFLLFFCNRAADIVVAADLTPVIVTQHGPLGTADLNVEVGEEVFFSAMSTTYTPDPTVLRRGIYEWNFGDGREYAVGVSGIVHVHYFMSTGDKTVTLSVKVYPDGWAGLYPIGTPVVATTTVTVHVTGTTPVAGFEIQHAPFNNRTKQYLYTQIPATYRTSSYDLVLSLLDYGNSYSNTPSTTVLWTHNLNGSTGEEKYLLDHTGLTVGHNYVVQAQILLHSNSTQVTGGLWRDLFTHSVATPTVSIDENNSFSFNGSLFFPIGSWMTDIPSISTFTSGADINMLHTQGYTAGAYDSASWGTYVDTASSYGLVAIGPARTKDGDTGRLRFDYSTDLMATYIQANKNKPAMFAWAWMDEPNNGGAYETVYPPVLAAWGYVGHREDANHPTFNLFYAYDALSQYLNVPNYWYYLASDRFSGGKKWVQDAIPFDVYPIHFRQSLESVTRGTYATYLDIVLGRYSAHNKNLVPLIPALAPCNAQALNAGWNDISDAQVYLEGWMNVIHGAKAILWFPYFDGSTIRWTAMKKFTDQMRGLNGYTALAPVVLGPEPTQTVTRTDQANAAGNRVDTMIRVSGGITYVFAARVTEPDPLTGQLLTVGVTSGHAGSGYQIADLLTVVDGAGGVGGVVYVTGVTGGAVQSAVVYSTTATYAGKGYSVSNGHATTCTRYNGNVWVACTGASGAQIDITALTQSTYQGTEPASLNNVQLTVSGMGSTGAIVTPVIGSGNPYNVTVTNGIITDNFAKNDVHIYEIGAYLYTSDSATMQSPKSATPKPPQNVRIQ